MTSPEIAAVVLNRGDRPDDLIAALRSVADQRRVATETIVVWNGGAPLDLPQGLVDHHVQLADNAGIPEGRNRGAAAATAPLLLFLDDDAHLVDGDILSRVVELFTRDQRLGVVCMRLIDEQGETMTRHVPRVGRRGPERSGEVTAFLGGASIVRAAAFEQLGGFPGVFFYSMEETDFAWRALDAGWTLSYEPELRVFHPRSEPSRHEDAVWRTARNRVWLAHRLLPLPLVPVYLANWLLISSVRLRRERASLVSLLRGVRDGWRSRPGPRVPLRWRTVWRMIRLGRPPIV